MYMRLIRNKSVAKAERLSLLNQAFSGQVHSYMLDFHETALPKETNLTAYLIVWKITIIAIMRNMVLFRQRSLLPNCFKDAPAG